MIRRIKNEIRHIRVTLDTKNRDEVLRLVTEFFGSPTKAELWMTAKNPLLGGITPEFMVRIGRSDKLLKFVRQCLEENKR